MAATRQLQQQAAEALQRRVGEALPPGVGAAEWAEHEQLLRTIEVQYLKHLDALRALDQLRRQPARSREPDLSQLPPHSIDVVDGLWEQVRTEEQEIGQLRVDADLLDKLIEERDQLRRRAVVAQRQSPLSEADRDAKLATLAAGQRALRADTEAAASVERSARAALEEEFDSREVETEVAASNVKLLRLLELGNSVSCRMWEQRYGLGQAGNPAASAKATEEAQLMLARVRQFRTYMLAVLDHLCRRFEAEEQRKAGLASNARRDAEHRVRAVRDGEAVLRRALRDTDGVEALPGNWLESLRMQREAASVADRLRLLYAEVGALAGGLWNFELVAVED